MSVIWTWLSQIRDSIYACIGLLFANFLTLKMPDTCTYHLITLRYSPDASSNVDYFPFSGWCEVWFIFNKQKQQSRCYTWTKSGPKNVRRPNQSDVGLKRSRSRTCTNTSYSKVANRFQGALTTSKFTWNDYCQPYTLLQFTLINLTVHVNLLCCSQLVTADSLQQRQNVGRRKWSHIVLKLPSWRSHKVSFIAVLFVT